MIYLYSHNNLRRWNRGELQVQLNVPGRDLPMGYCDGTEADEAELRAIAEAEEVENLPLQRRVLKTGREIWTVGLTPAAAEEEGDW